MDTSDTLKIIRRKSRQVMVGNVPIGGDAPVAIQTMTKAPASDVAGTLKQIEKAASAGCDIIRCAIPTLEHISSFSEVVASSVLPVVADIHFDHRLAIAAIKSGAAKIRINPGNMGNWDNIKDILDAAKNAGIPIRIGVNSGSIKNQGDTRPLHEALAEEALEYARRFEELGFHDIVLSLKATDAQTTVAVNKYVAGKCDYPLHIGITEAGTAETAIIKSAVGLGALLMDGIGDTIRVSITGDPADEIVACQKILRAAGYLNDRAEIISCPTCGRCTVELQKLADEVVERLRDIRTPLKVAVMGCEVNGPGEAKCADVGIAASGGSVTLFKKGEKLGQVPYDQAVDALFDEINKIIAEGK